MENIQRYQRQRRHPTLLNSRKNISSVLNKHHFLYLPKMSVKVQSQPIIADHLPKQAHVKAVINQWKIPSSIWDSLCHPRADEVIEEVDSYFLQHWNFPNEKAKKTFIDAGFSRVTSLYFPKALDNRIHFACRLLTVLFLIDGSLHFPIPLALLSEFASLWLLQLSPLFFCNVTAE